MSFSLPNGVYYVKFNLIISNDISNDVIIKNIKYLSVYNGKKWSNYRLGDTIGGKNHNLGKTLDNKISLIARRWPNSLMHKYFLLIKSKNITWNNFDELNILINDHYNNLISKNNFDSSYIAIHLRVGDGISWRTELEIYEKLCLKIKECSSLNNILIICGSHNCNFPPCKSTIDYLNSIIDILTKNKFNVYVRSGNSPDDDLVLMVKAEYFIPGGINNKVPGRPNGGGYNNLVKNLRNNYNIITI